MSPDCSVVIPCYNQAAFLGQAIDSVLAQTAAPVEIIVVDDGSTDDTGAIARSRPFVKLMTQTNRGVSHARNAGLRAASGSVILFLDADDVLLPEAIAIGRATLDQHKDIVAAVGRCQMIDAHGAPRATNWVAPVAGDAYRVLLRTNFIWTPGAALFRREAVVAAGGFATAYPASADYGLYLRLARAGQMACHATPVVLYREHPGNMSRDPALMLKSTLTALAAERRFVPAGLEQEFRAGRRAWQDHYADRTAELMHRLVRQPGGLWPAVRLASTLLRHHPAGFFRHARRRIATTVTGHPGRAAPDAELSRAGRRDSPGAGT